MFRIQLAAILQVERKGNRMKNKLYRKYQKNKKKKDSISVVIFRLI